MIRSIQAIIVKEIRENLRWAGLVCLITAALLAVGIYNRLSLGMSMLGDTFLIVCLLMYPAAGLSLGLVQVFQDTRKGRWQFITHRTMSHSQLFACKVLAGMALYLAATLLPLAAGILWVSTPGHLPGPFSWDMTEPSLAYLFSGLLWYATGLLVAARTARWLGSRIIPLGGAFVCAVFCQFCAMTLAQFIVLTAACTAFFLLAAWGAFTTGGQTPRVPRWSKPAIGLTLIAGWLVTIGVMMALAGSIIDMLAPPRQFSYRSYQLTRDGSVQIWTQRNGATDRNQDLSGHDLPNTAYDHSNLALLHETNLEFPDLPRESRIFRAADEGFLKPEKHVLRMDAFSRGNWFYLVGSRTIQGYESQTHSYMGSLGPNGLAGPGSPLHAFAQPLQIMESWRGSELLAFPDALYQVDISQRHVQRIYTAFPGDPIVSANSIPAVAGQPEYFVVATSKTLRIMQGDRTLVEAPIEQVNVPAYNTVQVGRTDSGQFVVAYLPISDRGGVAGSVSIYSPNGVLIRRTPLPVLSWDSTDDDFNSDSKLMEIGVLAPVPPAFFGTISTVKVFMGNPFPWHVIAIVLASALVFTAIGFAILRVRHAGRRRFYLWLPLLAILGLAGVLLLLSMLDKFASVRCACGKRRLVSESACPHCHTPAPPPAMQGIELFEPGLVGS